MISSPPLSHPLLSFSEDLNVLNLKQLMSEWLVIDPLPGELASVHVWAPAAGYQFRNSQLKLEILLS